MTRATKVLLVQPRTPVTYWGFQDAIRVLGWRAALPPLGLVTLAACLPPAWRLRLVDLNVTLLKERDLRWADAVFLTGMDIELPSMREVISRAHARALPIVVGGPTATLSPHRLPDVEVIFQGEAEERTDALVGAVSAARLGERRRVRAREEKPDLTRAPVPRFDLLDMRKYWSLSVQYSRGCPFDCEFCEISALYGRTCRTKSSEQILAELDALYGLGYRGSLFIVDDNFTGKRSAVRVMLPKLVEWQRSRGRPYDIFTEVSIDLAADPRLMERMVEAGFRSVFVGIETPSLPALQEAGKRQNLKTDLRRAVDVMTRHGLEVMGGFIVGFDEDGPEIFEAQRAFIQGSAIPLAMIGILNAFHGTRLWERMEAQGRLRGPSGGDNLARANFEPAMDEEVLLRGYRELLRRLYAPRAYYERCETYIEQTGELPISGSLGWRDKLYFLRILLHTGVKSRHRRYFWRLISRALRAPPHVVKWAAIKTMQGEHMFRYTRRHVLPQLDHEIQELAREKVRTEHLASAARAGSSSWRPQHGA